MSNSIHPDLPLSLNLPAKDMLLLLQGAGHLPHNVVSAVLKNAEEQIQAQIDLHHAAVAQISKE